jgi:hypothetical protein
MALSPQARNSIILAVLGVPTLIGGLLMATSWDTVSCGPDQMSQGDICEETKNGKTTEYTYDQMQSQQERMSYIIAGFGAVCLAGTGWYAFKARQRTEQEVVTAASSQEWMDK